MRKESGIKVKDNYRGKSNSTNINKKKKFRLGKNPGTLGFVMLNMGT